MTNKLARNGCYRHATVKIVNVNTHLHIRTIPGGPKMAHFFVHLNFMRLNFIKY